MCGINGIIGLTEQGRAEQIVHRMNDSLKHRGPDDCGMESCVGITLGHRRLSIIDLSSAGHQPMYSRDKNFLIVFNGEIYNYREIKKELTDYHFMSGTDTEVLLAAWQKWGVDCLPKLNGMFAFAIYDKIKQKTFLVRDRVGIKPLYYYKKKNELLFSSEIRALLNSGIVSKKINRKALSEYFRYQTVYAPDTIVRDINMLMPGHYLLIDKEGISENIYWKATDYTPGKYIENNGYKSVKKEVYELLFKSVEKRLVADVPFGAFLSGGIDSSIIVGLMSRVIPGKVNTFSVTFKEQTHSEAPYSRMISQRFKTNHHEIELTANDFLNLLPEAMDSMDHPGGDGPNTYAISKVTRNAGVKMALSGLGGDELFAGYDIFDRSCKLEKFRWMNRIPVGFRSLVGNLLYKTHPSVASDKIRELLSLNTISFSSSYPLSRRVLSEMVIQELTGEAYSKSRLDIENFINGRQFKYKDSLISRTSIAEIGTYMPNVLLRDTDQMSMASALEVRVPFLDHELIEYVLSLPDMYKYPSSPKQLLTDSVGDLIPGEIINRKKMGFELPWKYWLKNELFDWAETRVHNLSQREFMNEVATQQLWTHFLEDHYSVSWSRIWPLIALEDWLTRNEIEY